MIISVNEKCLHAGWQNSTIQYLNKDKFQYTRRIIFLLRLYNTTIGTCHLQSIHVTNLVQKLILYFFIFVHALSG